MELDLIEYLEGKNFDVEQICVLQEKFMKLNIADAEMIKKLNSIYKVFEFAELPDILINDLIINNISILRKADHDLINIAYVWLQTGILSDVVSKKGGLRFDNNLRVYLRNLYLNSGIQYLRSPISYYSMSTNDNDFSKDYVGYLNKDSKEMFNPSFENLVNFYGKGNSYEERLSYLQSYVSRCALKWYLDCLKIEKEKKKEDEGYGSI